MSKPRSGEKTATEDPSVGELSPYRWVPVSSHPHWYPVTPPTLQWYTRLTALKTSHLSHIHFVPKRKWFSKSSWRFRPFEIHFGLLNAKCVKWDVRLKCKIKCFVEEALWRRMKVELEIIYACVRGINTVMRKTQLCCACQKPECWICFAVQNAKRKLCSFEFNFLFTMSIYNIRSTMKS